MRREQFIQFAKLGLIPQIAIRPYATRNGILYTITADSANAHPTILEWGTLLTTHNRSNVLIPRTYPTPEAAKQAALALAPNAAIQHQPSNPFINLVAPD